MHRHGDGRWHHHSSSSPSLPFVSVFKADEVLRVCMSVCLLSTPFSSHQTHASKCVLLQNAQYICTRMRSNTCIAEYIQHLQNANSGKPNEKKRQRQSARIVSSWAQQYNNTTIQMMQRKTTVCRRGYITTEKPDHQQTNTAPSDEAKNTKKWLEINK